MTQNTRNRKSRSVDVEELNEVRDGVYVGEFVNEEGMDRQYVLVPSKIFSGSPDMIYDSDGYVGKYLIASAKVNTEFHDRLVGAIQNRQDYLAEKVSTSEESQRLREALDATSDETVTATLVQRLKELEGGSESVDEDAVKESIRTLNVALSELGVYDTKDV